MRRLPYLLLLLSGLPSATVAADSLPSSDVWMSHITGDLMKFWDGQAALGDPLGAFPSVRCDDGSLIDYKKPCAEANNPYLLQNIRYLVSFSRQTYAYGVAFHVTGDPRYLRYAKAGVDYIRANAIDRDQGGMCTTLDLNTGQWGPKAEFRNPQELGYGLLGMAFYYYLTRDPELLPDILAIKNYIFAKYYNPSLGAMQWLLANNGTERYDRMQLVSQLDQMNTYLVLLTPILPEPYQTEWKQSLGQLAHVMMDKFYSPGERLFFLTANSAADTDLTQSGTDFGHNAKALWMIRWTGRITGDWDLVSFAEDNARRLFDRAYQTDNGSWAEGLFAGGATDINKSWWIFAELDQLSGTMSLVDRGFADRLPQTYSYWLKYFVDKQSGEVWNSVDGKTNGANRDMPKQWFWKNGYHSMEHGMVAYISTRMLEGKPVTLYYGFAGDPPDQQVIQPYYFTGIIDSMVKTQDAPAVWAASYSVVY